VEVLILSSDFSGEEEIIIKRVDSFLALLELAEVLKLEEVHI